MRRATRFLLLGVAVFCGGCGREVAPVVIDGEAMGTSWRVTVAGEAVVDSAELGSEVSGLLEEIEAKFSHWRADSEVSRLNREGEEGAVSEETRDLIGLADTIRDASGGAFDIRVGKKVSARGFGPERAAGESAALDLSGIAKGHAVDRVAERLAEMGMENVLVEVGGELRARGVNGQGIDWTVGVEAPEPLERSLQMVVRLRDEAIASSGNYRLFREAGEGKIVTHIVDPRGAAANAETEFRAVSVVAARAAVADAWATAMFVLGEEEGMALAAKEGLAVCFLRREEGGEIRERMTPEFEARVER